MTSPHPITYSADQVRAVILTVNGGADTRAAPEATIEHAHHVPPDFVPPQLIYTVREAADQLRIGYSTAREHLRTGELRSFKIGGRRLIAGEDLVAFVRSQRGRGIGFDV